MKQSIYIILAVGLLAGRVGFGQVRPARPATTQTHRSGGVLPHWSAPYTLDRLSGTPGHHGDYLPQTGTAYRLGLTNSSGTLVSSPLSSSGFSYVIDDAPGNTVSLGHYSIDNTGSLVLPSSTDYSSLQLTGGIWRQETNPDNPQPLSLSYYNSNWAKGPVLNLIPSAFLGDEQRNRAGMIQALVPYQNSSGLDADGYAFDIAAGKPDGASSKWYPLFSVMKSGDIFMGRSVDPTYHVDLPATSKDYGGARLHFSGGINKGDNTDPLFIGRTDQGPDQSALRINLGDEGQDATGNGDYDNACFGYYADNDHTQWQNAVAALANGDLRVAQTITAKKVVVTANVPFPDYVFAPTYRLRTLAETEAAIKEEGHLPGMPSAAEVEKDGMDIGEQNRLLVEKVEELTLHLIRIQKELDALKTDKK